MHSRRILHDFADLSGDDIRACLAFAADRGVSKFSSDVTLIPARLRLRGIAAN